MYDKQTGSLELEHSGHYQRRMYKLYSDQSLPLPCRIPTFS